MAEASISHQRLLLTVRDVAAELRISRAQVYALLATGSLPEPIRLLGDRSHPRWHRRKLDDYLAALADRGTA